MPEKWEINYVTTALVYSFENFLGLSPERENPGRAWQASLADKIKLRV